MGNATAAYSTGCQQQQQWHHTYTPPPICGCGHHMLEYISGCQQQQQRWHHTYTAANQWLRSSQCMSTSCASSPREGCRGILACVRCARVRFVYMARPAKWLKSLKVQVVEGVPLTTRMFGRTYGLLGRFARGLVMFCLCVRAVLVYTVRNAAHTPVARAEVCSTGTYRSRKCARAV